MKKNLFFLLALIASVFCVYIIYKSNTMEIDEKEAAHLRDELHNLDIRNTIEHRIYYKKLYYTIASGEGFFSKVYKDTKGKLTIGYGFNMDRGKASLNEWNQIFEGSISFDSAKKGEILITKEQAYMLKEYGVIQREKELARIYAPYWDRIRLNERAIITDMYYQAPSLVGRNTNFSGYIKEYYKTNDEKYLELALIEIKFKSSHSAILSDTRGLKNRNNIRAIIFDSRQSPLYSKPHDELIPEDKKIHIIPGKTIISKEISAKFPESNNHGDYYIWRTRGDDKVRATHRELEGKVFKHEDDIMHPGDNYNCRCYQQRLPINAEIIQTKSMSFQEIRVELQKKFYPLHTAPKEPYYL